jgi:putative flippase GtrA
LRSLTFAYKVLELPLVPPNVLSWLIAVSGSHVMNSLITFHGEPGRTLNRKGYFTFVASGILGVMPSTALVVLSHFMPVIAVKLGSILVGFVVNFTMAHFAVLRPSFLPTKFENAGFGSILFFFIGNTNQYQLSAPTSAEWTI